MSYRRAIALPVLAMAVLTSFAGCEAEDIEEEEPAAAFAFSNFRVANLSATRVDILFDTSVATDCLIEFGPTTMLGTEATDPDMAEGEMASEHDVPLEDLLPGTLYHYRARATDADGVTELSELLSFTTLSGADSTEGRTNVALLSEGTSIVAVSSNFGNAANAQAWGIDNAFDDAMASEWSSNGDGSDAFVEIDFGQQRSITTFAFRSRKMSDGSSITQALQLRAGATVIGPLATPDPDLRYIFDLEAPLSTQTVRVEYLESTGGNTGAKEIQFYEARP